MTGVIFPVERFLTLDNADHHRHHHPQPDRPDPQHVPLGLHGPTDRTDARGVDHARLRRLPDRSPSCTSAPPSGVTEGRDGRRPTHRHPGERSEDRLRDLLRAARRHPQAAGDPYRHRAQSDPRHQGCQLRCPRGRGRRRHRLQRLRQVDPAHRHRRRAAHRRRGDPRLRRGQAARGRRDVAAGHHRDPQHPPRMPGARDDLRRRRRQHRRDRRVHPAGRGAQPTDAHLLVGDAGPAPVRHRHLRAPADPAGRRGVWRSATDPSSVVRCSG